MMSPGLSARKSAATADPDRTCSRDVRGSATPYFANTYFVKPEQSNPWFGVLPPQTYGTPIYPCAVCSSREAVAEGGGDSGIRPRVGARPSRSGAEVEVVVVLVGMLRMTVARTVSGDTPIGTDAQPAT